jgi:DNA repair ATPase RecN
MYDTLNKRVATYILEYYRQNNTINADDFIKKVEEIEPSLAVKVKRITKGESLPRKFNKQVFDVIKIQKPIQIEIDKLNEEYLQATDFMKKSYIIREREKKKKELQQLKSQFVVEEEN